ncbi:MAG: hypothetical protein AAF616_13275 [Bacteroidota bacterium]
MSPVATCIQCRGELSGRSDRKFCSDQCRATYHNQHQSAHEKDLQLLNKQLRKNRTILKTLSPTGKATLRKEVLKEMGFSFRHFTSIYGKEDKRYYLCYDYAYRPIYQHSITEGKKIAKVLIVQQQPFMRSFDPWQNLSI